ncbi:MAG: hypothetical protein ACFNUU_03625 [Campylobacter sp.]
MHIADKSVEGIKHVDANLRADKNYYDTKLNKSINYSSKLHTP